MSTILQNPNKPVEKEVRLVVIRGRARRKEEPEKGGQKTQTSSYKTSKSLDIIYSIRNKANKNNTSKFCMVPDGH